MIGITVRSRGGYTRRLCNAHNDIGARVEVRQVHSIGKEHWVKVKSHDMMKSSAEVFNGQQSELLFTPGISQKSRFAEEESRRYRGVRCA